MTNDDEHADAVLLRPMPPGVHRKVFRIEELNDADRALVAAARYGGPANAFDDEMREGEGLKART